MKEEDRRPKTEDRKINLTIKQYSNITIK